MSVLNKTLIGVVTVFTVASISVTYYAINNQDKSKSEKKQVEPIIKEPEYGNVIVNEYVEKRVNDNAKGFTSVMDTLTPNPVSLVYNGNGGFVLSGLKDKSVENKINEAIKKDFPNGFPNMAANYNDVISVTDNPTPYQGSSKFLNFRLDTGEVLKFEDLFTSGANIVSFLSNGIYKKLAHDACTVKGSNLHLNCQEKDTAKFDYVAIEDELFRLINYYKLNGVEDFGIAQGYIYFKLDNKWFKTYMGDCYKDISLYNRFKSTTDLYEKQSDDKNIITVFGVARYSTYMHKKVTDNVYVEVTNMNSITVDATELNSIIESVKNMATKNKNGYYLSILLGNGEESMDVRLFEANLDYFITNIEKDIIEAHRPVGQGAASIISYELGENSNYKLVSVQ